MERLDEDLDLTAHLRGTPGAAGGALPRPERAALYRTRAIVCHHGTTLREGHYTSWVRAAPAPAAAAAAATAGNAWVQYDDSVVGRPQSNLPPNVASDAVLLFYEQIRAGRPEDPAPASAGIETDDAAPLSQGFVGGRPGPAPVTVEDDVEMSDGEPGHAEPRRDAEGHDEDDPMDTS